MKLSVVIPIHNEVESIPELFERLIPVCEAYSPYEIIAVDDGSNDGSHEALKAEKRKFPRINIIKFVENAGKSDALNAGFAKARGELVATLDSDLQNPPEEIAKLIGMLGDHDLAMGWRTERKDRLLKRFASIFANTVRRSLLQDSSHDTACALKVFRRNALMQLTMYKGMHRFFPALFGMHGFRVIEVPIADEERKYGISKYGTLARGIPGFFDMLAVVWMRKRKLTYEIETVE